MPEKISRELCLLFSRQERDQQLKTCVYLTQKNEQLQEECDGLSQQVNCWKVHYQPSCVAL